MILQDLKEKTYTQHKQLESHPLLHQLTSPHLSLSAYTTILRKFYGFFSPLENTISQFSPEHFLQDYHERRKANLLLQDLEKLEQGDMTHPPKTCDDLPPVEDIDSAMGVLYVMEGSTLGGQMISRHVEKTLGLNPTHGTSFFYGYGKDTGKRWKKFQEALLTFSEQRASCEPIITSSQRTFSKLNHWLNI